jgi:hypothetical protein
LLAQLHFDSLAGMRSPKAVRTALETLPKGSDGYDRAYDEAMERIHGQVPASRTLAEQALSWITCAKRTLTTSELQQALAVEIGCSELDRDNLTEIQEIVSVCAGLVTVDKESNNIRLVHYITQEYFERTQKVWFPKAESDITTICVTYLSFSVFESGFCEADNEFEKRLGSHQLFDYAAHNWGHHACKALTLGREVIHFLDCKAKVEASSQALFAVKRYSGHLNYSQRVPRQMTGLHLAAFFGVQEALNSLLEYLHTLDLRDSYGRTPLSWAAENGRETVVTLLLDKGANFESKDNDGRTPLSWAAELRDEAVVTLLLDKGADLESEDNDGRAPLLLAAEVGHEAVATLLLDKGANIDAEDKLEWTALQLAALKMYVQVEQLF